MRRILFLFGGQACVPEDPLHAAKLLGYETVVMASRLPCGLTADLVDHFQSVQLRRSDAVVESAHSLAKTFPFDGVVGYDDQAIPLVARIANALGLPGHPVEAADAARDKVVMKQHFAAAGLPIAKYHLATGEDDAVRWATDNGYPVVVKPIRGSASQGVIRANDEPALRDAYRRVRRIVREFGLDTGDRSDEEQLVEAYLDGSEYSAELIVECGQATVFCRFEKPRALQGPYFEETIYATPPQFTEDETRRFDRLAIDAVESLGLRQGLAHCEIRWSSKGPFVLEVGARLIGGACSRVFRHVLGEDIHSTVLRLAVGEPIQVPEQRPGAAGAMMIPIPKEGRVTAIRGLEDAQRVHGIQDVIVSVRLGDAILPFPEQSCYIGFLTANGSSVEGVRESLEQAADIICLEVKQLQCVYWARDLSDCVSFNPPMQSNIQLLGEYSREQAREIVTPLIALAHFGEYPTGEAQKKAAECVAWIERGNRGECAPDSWMISANGGVALGSANGETCFISCLGVPPAQRRKGIGRTLVRSMMALFAKRGCARMKVLLDPRQPAPNALYQDLGFRPEACADQTCCCD